MSSPPGKQLLLFNRLDYVRVCPADHFLGPLLASLGADRACIWLRLAIALSLPPWLANRKRRTKGRGADLLKWLADSLSIPHSTLPSHLERPKAGLVCRREGETVAAWRRRLRARVRRTRTDFRELRRVKGESWQARAWVGEQFGQQINLGLFTRADYGGEEILYGTHLGSELRGAEGAAAYAIVEFHRLWDLSAVKVGVPGASLDAFEVLSYLQSRVHRPRFWDPTPVVPRRVLPKYASLLPDGRWCGRRTRSGPVLCPGPFEDARSASEATYLLLGVAYPRLG